MIAIELKVTEFKPEYAGKMQFYLTALNKQEKIEGENPSIGIIICKSKDRTVVEYALNDSHKPIGVATYSLQHELPEEMKKYLPTAEEITQRLNILDE